MFINQRVLYTLMTICCLFSYVSFRMPDF